jgi:hypothetical protein
MLDENYILDFSGLHFQPQQAYNHINKDVCSGALLVKVAAERRRHGFTAESPEEICTKLQNTLLK